jgi:hypothetical protein
MLTLPQAAPAQPTPGFGVFWAMLGRVVSGLTTTGAHAEVTVIIKDGKPALVRVTQTCLPGQLPKL